MQIAPLFDLSGKKILITGAAKGNGAALARGMSDAGAEVILVDVDDKGVQRLADRFRAEGRLASAYRLDVSQIEGCLQLAEEVGDIDVLINNAGLLKRIPFASASVYEAFAVTLAVNVHGPFNMTRAFLPALKRRRGNIINIASIQSFVAAPTSPTYAISKGALAQLTRTLAAELATDNIRVNAIAPGMIATEMSASTRDNEEVMQRFLQHVPMKRAAQPDELIGPATFLASSAASYVTGVILPVDGGYLVS
ncbi:SDR family NAD(P)-dependent oxidoreductase [Klebsiella quasipneumoniae]|nr:SDR family oxidoreductase [Klebsiella quasipneumoniae]